VKRLYPNLDAEMARSKITKRDLAKCLDVRYATIIDKTKGKRPFLLDEAVKIKRRFFPHCDLEYLFEKNQSQNSA
jgi:DNA-binding XRE family transcriptional regulator